MPSLQPREPARSDSSQSSLSGNYHAKLLRQSRCAWLDRYAAYGCHSAPRKAVRDDRHGWSIGVVRDRIGQRDHRFFATVYLGSGLLFVGMLFVASAVTAAFLADVAVRAGLPQPISNLDRRIGAIVLHVYAIRMAAVFMVATAMIGLRTSF